MKNLLQHRLFRRLLGGWTIGNLADSALYLTLAIWAKDLTDSSAAAGLVFFALGVPILATPLLGMLADRWHRKDRKSTRLNSSHVTITSAVFCLKKTIIR